MPEQSSSPSGEAPEELAEGTLISHLVELRQRLLRSVLAVLAAFIALAPFANTIFLTLARPLQDRLAEDSQLIVTTVGGGFLVPFKATLFVAVFLAMPYVLWEAWRFVAPALYRSEKRFAVPLVASSIVLFYTGVAFAYFLVVELTFGFFVAATPENVAYTPDIGQYLSFVLAVFLAFGVAFEVPIATFVLVWSRIVRHETLRNARPYVFLGAFVAGMLLTPQDAFSQSLLAVPMYLLYEAGLLVSRLLLPEVLVESEQS